MSERGLEVEGTLIIAIAKAQELRLLRYLSVSGAIGRGLGHDGRSAAQRRRSSAVSGGNRYAYHHLWIARLVPQKCDI